MQRFLSIKESFVCGKIALTTDRIAYTIRVRSIQGHGIREPACTATLDDGSSLGELSQTQQGKTIAECSVASPHEDCIIAGDSRAQRKEQIFGLHGTSI